MRPPELPDDVVAGDLDRGARSRLRTLSKDNADGVARHLVMAGRLLEEQPEEAYRHAQAALARAGRVDVVREAAAVTAYRTGRFAEALREFRTVRRLNGSEEHLPAMADCERGLGRPERALSLVAESADLELSPEIRVELAIVAAGARMDLGEPEAALATLRQASSKNPRGAQEERLAEAMADVLIALGREQEAREVLRAAGLESLDDVVVFDLAGTAEEPLDADGNATGDGAGDAGRDVP